MFKNHTTQENKLFNEHLTAQEAQVMIYFVSRDYGTAQDIADELYERLNSVSTRLSALVAKGELKETGYVKLNKKTGRYGTIYAKPHDMESALNKIKAAMSYNGQSIRKANNYLQADIELYAVFGISNGQVVSKDVVLTEYKAMQLIKEYKASQNYETVMCKKFYKKFNL